MFSPLEEGKRRAGYFFFVLFAERENGREGLAGRAYLPSVSALFHAKTLNCEKGIRWELLARLCPNTTGAELRSVCTEAGMFAIRDRRKAVTEKDMMDAVNKVVKGYAKFSATPKYMAFQ